MRRILIVILCVALVSLGFHVVPERAQAVEPVTMFVLSAAAIAALVTVAYTYEVSDNFADTCADMDATTQEGLVVQSMIDHATGYPGLSVLSTALQTVVDDGRLLKACIAWLKQGGFWPLVEQAAANAVEWGGNVYYDVRLIWEHMGFLPDSEWVTTYPNHDSYQSGHFVGYPLAGWSLWTTFSGAEPDVVDSSVAHHSLEPSVALAAQSAMWQVAFNPDYWIKTDAAEENPHYGGTINFIQAWWVSSQALHKFWCEKCQVGLGVAGGSQFAVTYWNDAFGTGMEVTNENAASLIWLSDHAALMHAPPTQGEGFGTIFPDGTTLPSTTTIPKDIVDSIGTATTFPQHPSRGVVPPYVPPTTGTIPWSWPNAGTAGGVIDTTLEWTWEFDDWITDQISDITNAGEGNTFKPLIDWLLLPLKLILQAIQAIIRLFATLLQWCKELVGALLNALASLLVSLFVPNADYVSAVVMPAIEAVWESAMQRWPFCIGGIFNDVLNEGTGSQAPLTFTLDWGWEGFGDGRILPEYSGHEGVATIDLRDGLEYLESWRWFMVAIMALGLVSSLWRMFRPQVTA